MAFELLFLHAASVADEIWGDKLELAHIYYYYNSGELQHQWGPKNRQRGQYTGKKLDVPKNKHGHGPQRSNITSGQKGGG